MEYLQPYPSPLSLNHTPIQQTSHVFVVWAFNANVVVEAVLVTIDLRYQFQLSFVFPGTIPAYLTNASIFLFCSLFLLPLRVRPFFFVCFH